MTNKEISEALAAHQFTTEFTNLVSFKKEYTCVKYLIKALAQRTNNAELNNLLIELKKIVLGSIVNGRIKLAQQAARKEDNKVLRKALADADSKIKSATEKVGKLLTAVAATYVKKEVNEKIWGIIADVVKAVNMCRDSYKEANVVLGKCDDAPEAPEIAADSVSLSDEANTQPSAQNAAEVGYEVQGAATGDATPEHVDILAGIVTESETQYKEAV